MDWFSWLSRSSLEASLIYEYGLAFGRNELKLEDATHFNHEFLQSMGVLIAKHRLEILKLAKNECHGGMVAVRGTKKLSGVIKNCLRKCLRKLVPRQEEGQGATELMALPREPNWYQGKWRGVMVRKNGTEEFKGEKGMQRSRTIALSGPLDGRMHERIVSTNKKILKLSGPLDGKMNERMMCTTNRSPVMTTRPLVDGRFLGTTARSPRLSGPIDAKLMVRNSSPMKTRPFDELAESPMGYSPYHNKIKGDSDFDEYGIWPTLFENLKPT